MILEHAQFVAGPAGAADFEAAMAELVEVLAASPGYLGHAVYRSIETPGRYVALIRWESVDAHVVGFRQSPAFQRWAERLGEHRAGVQVEHCELILARDWEVPAP